ncbi:carboxymuconolactone decarboxylase family protein [Aestuariicella sp. G3-2]|uniref:carboxymuconolactone decarboxylase family protein n=1 Tax=Pseudomaricurvus albidus TaxID=2842452 RepID=UPI001C0C8A68|nr:carboxymuconolactone decarboxylase family protein [Aestuariicella albida]MBU3069522.1 carboxymuconolactone decarboxylase family protein [Aestuariicella albida]
MRLSQSRIAPLSDVELEADHLSDDQKAALEPYLASGRVFNIFRTLARAPKALARFNQWGGYILSARNELPSRERELVILRTGWCCRSGYEWAQHRIIGLRCGLTEVEIENVKRSIREGGWSELDSALLQAVDDLVSDHFVSDSVWSVLSKHLTQKQCMDVVFTVGQYTQVSMMLNSFGVQLDEGLPADSDLAVRG